MIAFLKDAFVFRLWPNAALHRGPTIGREGDGDAAYRLAVFEFDDQGACFDRETKMRELDDGLRDLAGTSPVIVLFVHGWKHNAGADDGNLRLFRTVLSRLAGSIAREQPGPDGVDRPRSPVLGVYLGWRGATCRGNWLWQQLSFWGRQRAAQRVALGSTRELLGRLKAFRNGQPGDAPHATLVAIGHSFGGLVLFTAVAQSLIEAAATDADEIVPSFGDLVVLLNPAFVAARYMPIWQIVSKRKRYPDAQKPVFISITAENDWATGYAFPIGNLYRSFVEACHGSKQRQAIRRTMGHLDWMRTHTLRLASAGQSSDDGTALLEARASRSVLAGVEIENVDGRTLNPFWVASATRGIIDGHNGIGKPRLEEFIAGLVGGHVSLSRRNGPAPRHRGAA